VADVGVDLAMLEALLQVVVDGLVGDLAQQREVRDSDLLLLGDFEGGFLDLRLRIAAVISAPPSEDGCFGGARRLAISTFCLTLFELVSTFMLSFEIYMLTMIEQVGSSHEYVCEIGAM
jgi:hypothetical protein